MKQRPVAVRNVFAHAVSSIDVRPLDRPSVQYGGSRKSIQRFEYSDKSYAGFVELAPEFAPKPSEFFASLENVHGVAEVAWNTTKTSQGNVGNHYCEQNILVTPTGGNTLKIPLGL